MFLAWKEITFNKSRYALIIGVLVLVSYLVYFLTGQAYGLSQDNRTSIDKWSADAIVLSDEANSTINMSMVESDAIAAIEGADEVAKLGQIPVVMTSQADTDEEERITATVFGIEADSFIAPNIIEGQTFTDDFEVVADISLQEEFDLQIGDQLPLSIIDETITIVGFTDNAKFNVAPVLYTNLATFQALRSLANPNAPDIVSAFVVRAENPDKITLTDDNLALYPIAEFINNLPGYSAQVLTFSFMIIFLIIIASIVIGIFMYVLTVQKIDIFGVMKAQGIPTSFIGMSVVGQTFILATLGSGIGLGLTLASAYVLPSAVPFAVNYEYFAIITGLTIGFALIGSLFSVRVIAKINPLQAIG
ncbi:ABC transporter permease [Aerococcus agrisoli]|uniref:Putative hemin transport system permease protein HrtB n=1 Tax=Aerococcus agrisoli TaxID=2487350 RepID=A0A3N4GIV6_9LACT|nr:ABC transporter permease [Aerococcus agrisoli]RPA61317.1 ABC transporter permease [Aerococcus agrisoli]